MSERIPYLPNPDQELLLKAALMDGDIARDSWARWRSRVALEGLDHASTRLLPLLLENLTRLGVVHSDLDRYQSVARHTWLENQLLAKHSRRILSLFSEARIPAMPVKGLAVAPLYYGNFRLRAMSDVDVLVPVAFAAQAARLLTAEGWQSSRYHRMACPQYFSTVQAAAFSNAHDVEFDLHWHISHECCRPDADDAFWLHSQPMTFNGFATRTLSDTDHLFHACIHGGRPNAIPPIRWVADSAQILRAGKIDWDRLLLQTQNFNLVRRLQRTLSYLRDAMSMPVPAPVLSRLMAMTPGRLETLEERMAFSGLPETLKMLARRYIHYRRNLTPNREMGFLRYLEASYGTQSLVGTARWAMKRSRQKFRTY